MSDAVIRSAVRAHIEVAELRRRIADDSGESHLLAVMGVAGVVAGALFAFRTQISGIFTTFSNEIGNAAGN